MEFSYRFKYCNSNISRHFRHSRSSITCYIKIIYLKYANGAAAALWISSIWRCGWRSARGFLPCHEENVPLSSLRLRGNWGLWAAIAAITSGKPLITIRTGEKSVPWPCTVPFPMSISCAMAASFRDSRKEKPNSAVPTPT